MGWKKEYREKFNKDFPDLSVLQYFELEDLKKSLMKDLKVLRNLRLDDLDVRRIITTKKSAIGRVNKQIKKITDDKNKST